MHTISAIVSSSSVDGFESPVAFGLLLFPSYVSSHMIIQKLSLSLLTLFTMIPLVSSTQWQSAWLSPLLENAGIQGLRVEDEVGGVGEVTQHVG